MKTKLFATIMMLVAVVIMSVTTAVSFVYWKNGVTGSDISNSYPIVIGSGNEYTTLVDLNDISHSGIGKRLVPVGREDAANGLVSSFTIKVEVTWQAVDPSDTTNYPKFQNEVGLLSVTCVSIKNSDGDEFLDKKGYGTNYIFEISVVDVTVREAGEHDFDIGGGDKVTIEITVTMYEPANIQDYNKLANKSFSMEFNFSIQSTSDQAQNQGLN